MKRARKETDKDRKPRRGILGIGEKLAELFELPPDMFGNRPKVTAVGRGEVLIENFKGIMDFQEGMVRINTSTGVIRITGSGITIKEITNESVIIGGKISNIDYDA
ncbi:MAG: sporulation protein YqfC [Clostridiaceae bacterium]|nr:sporulation protein YqfC [Clostridiaceae bacterium]HPU45405.1 sporulation protein YqfC [Thermoclostridium sp.]